jgi:HK97 gp10 family phage protein
MIDLDVKGLAELERKMRELTDKVQGQMLRQAVNAGAQIVKKAARDKVPVDTGLLRRNIVVGRSRRQSAPGRETYNVFVKKEKRTYADTRANRRKNRVGKKYEVQGPAYYWRFLEFGTKKMQARPFLRPALVSNQQAAINAIREKLASGILKAGR